MSEERWTVADHETLAVEWGRSDNEVLRTSADP